MLSWSSLRKHHNFIDDHDNLDDYDDHDDINFFPKLKNDWSPLSSTFHEEQPETLIEWKFKSITDHGGYMRIMAVICSGVGARDTCVSKNVLGKQRTIKCQNFFEYS